MIRTMTAAAALALIAGGAFLLAPQGAHAPLPFAADAQEADAADDTAPAEVTEMTLGEADAPVEVIEYASFTCPHCRDFHAGPFEKLKADYIDTGKVHFIYREVYLDRFGLWAGMVARCGGEEKYFGLVDLIYDNQSEWVQGEPGQIAANLRRLGKTAGLADEEVDACLRDADKAQAMVARFEETSQADDISATPSFVIDGEKHSNMSYDDLSALIDGKLDDASN